MRRILILLVLIAGSGVSPPYKGGDIVQTPVSVESVGDERIPIACVPSALTAAERKRSAELRRELAEKVAETREETDGYSFRYPAEKATLALVGEWMTYERLCCPFLTFTLEWKRGRGQPWLRISGPEGTKAFLAAEMPELPRK
jgi:hypothetical protein